MASDSLSVHSPYFEATVCWVVALKSEAKPIISYFKLDHKSGNSIFPIYKNDKLGHSLIVSGVGQINAAAATAYLASESSAPPWASWINVGIAGSADGEVGKLYQGIKITNPTKEKVFFPGYRFSKIVSSAEIQTLDYPKPAKKNGVLHDMEASGFIDFATRFSCNELVFSFKVVSDNSEQDMKLIDKTMVNSLIGNRLQQLDALLNEIITLSKLEKQRLQIPDEVEEVFKQFHFSVTRRNQLIQKLRKWKVQFPNRSINDLVKEAKTAADVIRNIDDALTDLKFDWT